MRRVIYSKKEIRKAFKLLGLSSEKQRKLFEKMRTPEDKAEQMYLFIKAGSKSENMGLEEEGARLE